MKVTECNDDTNMIYSIAKTKLARVNSVKGVVNLNLKNVKRPPSNYPSKFPIVILIFFLIGALISLILFISLLRNL